MDNFEIDENIEATNKLLLEIIKNQKFNIANLVKIIKVTMICFTFLIIAMIIGFFAYESQFEVTDWEKTIMQEADTEGENSSINAIINTGEMQYGESKTNSSDQR